MNIPDNEQHIENRASNRGAQGSFYGPVNINQTLKFGADAERFKAIYQLPSPRPTLLAARQLSSV